MIRYALLWIIGVVLLAGCSTSSRRAPAEGYRVVSYDAKTGHWVLIRTGTFSGERQIKRMIVVCDFFKWADHEAITGPDACHLQIGRLMVNSAYDYFSGKTKDFLDITEMPSERIAFTEGVGDDRVSQHFKIVHQELLADH